MTLRGFVGAHFVVTITLKIVGFKAIELAQSENKFVLTKALRYHKHLRTSLMAVGDNIIGKPSDKHAQVMNGNASTK